MKSKTEISQLKMPNSKKNKAAYIEEIMAKIKTEMDIGDNNVQSDSKIPKIKKDKRKSKESSVSAIVETKPFDFINQLVKQENEDLSSKKKRKCTANIDDTPSHKKRKSSFNTDILRSIKQEPFSDSEKKNESQQPQTAINITLNSIKTEKVPKPIESVKQEGRLNDDSDSNSEVKLPTPKVVIKTERKKPKNDSDINNEDSMPAPKKIELEPSRSNVIKTNNIQKSHIFVKKEIPEQSSSSESSEEEAHVPKPILTIKKEHPGVKKRTSRQSSSSESSDEEADIPKPILTPKKEPSNKSVKTTDKRPSEDSSGKSILNDSKRKNIKPSIQKQKTTETYETSGDSDDENLDKSFANQVRNADSSNHETVGESVKSPQKDQPGITKLKSKQTSVKQRLENQKTHKNNLPKPSAHMLSPGQKTTAKIVQTSSSESSEEEADVPKPIGGDSDSLSKLLKKSPVQKTTAKNVQKSSVLMKQKASIQTSSSESSEEEADLFNSNSNSPSKLLEKSPVQKTARNVQKSSIVTKQEASVQTSGSESSEEEDNIPKPIVGNSESPPKLLEKNPIKKTTARNVQKSSVLMKQKASVQTNISESSEEEGTVHKPTGGNSDSPAKLLEKGPVQKTTAKNVQKTSILAKQKASVQTSSSESNDEEADVPKLLEKKPVQKTTAKNVQKSTVLMKQKASVQTNNSESSEKEGTVPKPIGGNSDSPAKLLEKGPVQKTTAKNIQKTSILAKQKASVQTSSSESNDEEADVPKLLEKSPVQKTTSKNVQKSHTLMKQKTSIQTSSSDSSEEEADLPNSNSNSPSKLLEKSPVQKTARNIKKSGIVTKASVQTSGSESSEEEGNISIVANSESPPKLLEKKRVQKTTARNVQKSSIVTKQEASVQTSGSESSEEEGNVPKPIVGNSEPSPKLLEKKPVQKTTARNVQKSSILTKPKSFIETSSHESSEEEADVPKLLEKSPVQKRSILTKQETSVQTSSSEYSEEEVAVPKPIITPKKEPPNTYIKTADKRPSSSSNILNEVGQVTKSLTKQIQTQESSDETDDEQPKQINKAKTVPSPKLLKNDNKLPKAADSEEDSDDSDSPQKSLERTLINVKNDDKFRMDISESSKINGLPSTSQNRSLNWELHTWQQKLVNTYPNVIQIESNINTPESEAEYYLLRVPRDVDASLLVKQKVNVDSESHVVLGSNKYTLQTQRSNSLNIRLRGSELTDIEKVVTLHRCIDVASMQNLETVEEELPHLPGSMRNRHPLFGVNFKKALKLDSDIIEKFVNVDRRKRKRIQKKKKSKNKKTDIASNDTAMDIFNSEALFSTSQPESNSDEIKKKKKKKKSKKDIMESSLSFTQNELNSSNVSEKTSGADLTSTELHKSKKRKRKELI